MTETVVEVEPKAAQDQDENEASGTGAVFIDVSADRRGLKTRFALPEASRPWSCFDALATAV